jgi:hypothetical protein
LLCAVTGPRAAGHPELAAGLLASSLAWSSAGRSRLHQQLREAELDIRRRPWLASTLPDWATAGTSPPLVAELAATVDLGFRHLPSISARGEHILAIPSLFSSRSVPHPNF